MRNLKWIALAPAALGIVFLFFGIIWAAAVQLGVAVGLLALAALIWRSFSGEWHLAADTTNAGNMSGPQRRTVASIAIVVGVLMLTALTAQMTLGAGG